MSEVFQAGFGARLKAAREVKSMAVADVANKLKLTARQIEAIENEDLSHLPSEVFVRGFVRNYARLVGVETDSLIAPVVAEAVVSESITAPNAGLDVSSNGLRQWLVYPLLAVVVFLLLVAALYQWLRQGEDSLIVPSSESVTQSFIPESVVPATPAPEGAAPDDAISTITPLTLPSVNAPPTTSNVVQPVTAPQKPAEASSSSVVNKPTAPEAMPPNANADTNVKPNPRSMRFAPSQDAWIQVVDAKGNRFSRLVRAGTTESFSGEPPFRLVVGEAALVKLTYNGHNIDLTPFIGQKVARLTLE